MTAKKEQKIFEKNKQISENKEEIKKEIERFKKERDEYLAYAQKSRADFLNYKKEESERIRAVVDYEKEEWILELLQIMDLFEKAEQEISKTKEEKAVFEGFIQTEKRLADFLRRQGVGEIEIKAGDRFDPEIAEAVEIVSGEDGQEGEVAEVLQKGYRFKDKVLRPARITWRKNP
jgi:molecular chaperone GrpE